MSAQEDGVMGDEMSDEEKRAFMLAKLDEIQDQAILDAVERAAMKVKLERLQAERDAAVAALVALVSIQHDKRMGGIVWSEFGTECLYCEGRNDGFTDDVQHEPDCPIVRGRDALGAG